ncbi:pyridoxamine 5'-phosphate oxidase [Mycobacterium sp. GA-2829]|nr:pyridoxamine 5'-phosphate oxidase [Mycobacterium sp. GA-2829]
MRRQRFATLSTVGPSGGPQATGVVYAVSPPDEPAILYVTTRTSTAKVCNIRAAPQVAFVIPVPHRFLAVVPPAVVQFRGFADILEAEHPSAVRAFQRSWFHRRILNAERLLVAEQAEMCFIAIRPQRTVFTYGIGMSALDVVRRPRQAIGEVRLPTGR